MRIVYLLTYMVVILLLLKDAEREIRGEGRLSATTNVDSLPRTCHLQVRQVDSCESASSVSQVSCDRRDSATCRREFADCFFETLPLVVHPLILLRLLCHKMFGGMLRRRKTSTIQIGTAAASSSSPTRGNSLTPPPVVDTELCPPAWASPDSAASSAAARPHRKSNVHVHITVPGGAAAASSVATQLDDEFRVHRRRTRRAGSMDKHLLRVGSAKRRRSVQAVMGLVMKTIGDSILQPLDVDEGAAALTAAGETPGTDERRWRVFFRLPSIRKRSQSQGFIASSARISGSTDSFIYSHRSSSASISGTAGGTGRPDESEIKDFQKMLINLPIYEVDTHCTPLMTAGGREDAAGGLPMSRFSSVPDQLEYLHMLSAQLIDGRREQKETSLMPTAVAGKSERAPRESDTVPALPSDGRGCRGETGSGGGGSRRRRGLASTSSTSSRESSATASTSTAAGGPAAGRRAKLHSDSLTSRNAASAASSLTPLRSDAIVFHFAAATPCESPNSLIDQPLMTFTDMSAAGEHQQTAGRSSSDYSQMATTSCDHTPRISPPSPAASLSDSRSSLTLRPNNLWNGQNASPSRDRIATPSGQSGHSTASSLSPKSSFNRADYSANVLHSPNLSFVLPSSPGCSELSISHRAVMAIVERWVDACRGVDLDATPLVKKEMKDFLGKMASLGVEYRAWSHRIRDKLKLEVSHQAKSFRSFIS